MKCVRVINKVLIMKCKKKERETLKAKKEQEDLLFICLVCSLQAAFNENNLSIKEFPFYRFRLLHYRFHTV